MSSSEDVPKPRLCHLIKWPDFDGYGFNLHAEKTKSGQFIGQVDDDSPAESAGLKQGDRIVEVNGVNIANENHKQVVERIKAIPNETKLLVLDDEADKYYKSKKILVKHSLPYVVRLRTAIPRPRRATTNGGDDNNKINGDAREDADERRSQVSSAHSDRESTNDDKLSHNSGGSNRSTPAAERKDDSLSSKSSSGSVTNFTPPLTPVNSLAPGGGGGGGGGEVVGGGGGGGEVNNGDNNSLNFNMSVQQMRAMLANRKKYDPKKESMDLRKKHAIIQEM